MTTDMFGRPRMKINLHLHTTESDGRKTPEEAAAIYREAGYDILAITDHWKYRKSGEIGGLRILGGAEICIFREGKRIIVKCSPVSRISFFSNAVWGGEGVSSETD